MSLYAIVARVPSPRMVGWSCFCAWRRGRPGRWGKLCDNLILLLRDRRAAATLPDLFAGLPRVAVSLNREVGLRRMVGQWAGESRASS